MIGRAIADNPLVQDANHVDSPVERSVHLSGGQVVGESLKVYPFVGEKEIHHWPDRKSVV